jgi:deoxyribonuclease V
VARAERVQAELRQRVDLSTTDFIGPETVVGLDVSYATDSDRVVAAAVVIEPATLRVVEQVTVAGVAEFPYVPGFLAFREVPVLERALGLLKTRKEVLVCDGYGVAHPRRFGLACHLGVVTGIPAFGVAKTPFLGGYAEPGEQRGEFSELRDSGELLGRVLRTRYRVKPVFVSVGHRISLAEATALTLALTPKYRLPETTRQADHLSRRAL